MNINIKNLKFYIADMDSGVGFLQKTKDKFTYTKIDNLNYLMKLQNKSAKECIFFGDAKTDLDAAKECGVEFIGIGESIKKTIKEEGGTYF